MNEPGDDGTRLEWDWYGGIIPSNVRLGPDAYLATSHAFTEFRSLEPVGLELGEAAGLYEQTALIVGPKGRVLVGAFSCLNSTFIYAQESVELGAYVLTAWGCVITDHWLAGQSLESRPAALRAVSEREQRTYPRLGAPRPVTIEDNVWLGFNSVILPGVRIGRGSVIGARAIVAEDVPPYSVVVGNPARVVRTLQPTDTDEAIARARSERISGAGFGSNIRGQQ